MSIVLDKLNTVTDVVQTVDYESEKVRGFSQVGQIMIDEVLTFDQNPEENLDHLLNDCFTMNKGNHYVDSLLSVSATTLDGDDDYGCRSDWEQQAKISVDGMDCNMRKFILAEDLKDDEGNDLFTLDSVTGKLSMTEAGVNSFINDAESLPDLHTIDVQVQVGHSGLGIKEMIFVEKSLSGGISVETNESDSIDAMLYGDDDVTENDLFEFLESNSDLVL